MSELTEQNRMSVQAELRCGHFYRAIDHKTGRKWTGFVYVLEPEVPDNYEQARYLLEVDGMLATDASGKSLIFEYVDDGRSYFIDYARHQMRDAAPLSPEEGK